MYFDEGKTVIIPIRMVNGHVEYFYGGELPELVDGTIGDLIIPSSSVRNEEKLKSLQLEKEEVFFQQGTELMIGLSDKYLPQSLKCYAQRLKKVLVKPDTFCTPIQLLEDLKIKFRGTKKPILVNCKCFIPSLKVTAQSLNQAYSIISKYFEPERNSYGGNVFLHCYYFNKNYWRPLSDRRDLLIKDFEIKYYNSSD